MKTYANYISLGFFCSVAMELDRIGLRSCSSPFDWCISDWNGIELLMNNEFVDLFEYELLAQNKNNHQHYKNIKYNIEFFHDFNRYTPLKIQLPDVKMKYERRIKRFYSNITKPTLFIRYIKPDPEYTELRFLEKNYEKICNYLKSYNKDNDIIFIANSDMHSEIIKLYNVEADENDFVARHPFKKNQELYTLLKSFEFDDRKKNIKMYKKKEIKRFINRQVKKTISFFEKFLKKDYIHNKQY